MSLKSWISDVDGVVADFTGYLLEVVGSDLKPEDITEWDVLGFLNPDQKEHALEALSGQDFWLNLPVIDGAKDGVSYLNARGIDLSWVTSPWESCNGWESARRAWLEDHFQMSANGHHYIPTSSKEKVVADVFVDDKPSHVTRWSQAHPTRLAFIYDAPHNQDFEWPNRFTWERIRDIL